MTPTLILAIAGGVLIAAGVYLLLERSLMRILAGIMLAGNGVNLLFLVAAGPAGLAPIVGADPELVADPLPHAMVLTAIVITLATSAFLLAMSYRSFQLEGHDEVADDVEDAIVRRRAEADLSSEAYVESGAGDDDTESGGRSEPVAKRADRVARAERAAALPDGRTDAVDRTDPDGTADPEDPTDANGSTDSDDTRDPDGAADADHRGEDGAAR